MKTGTRRMWSRRVLRAGWALAPVLRFPAAAWNFFFGSKESTGWTLAIGFILCAVGSCTKYESYMDRAATGTELEAAMKGNACMIDLMPRRQKLDYNGAPITNRHLLIGKSDCQEYYDASRKVAEQDAALKKLGAKK